MLTVKTLTGFGKIVLVRLFVFSTPSRVFSGETEWIEHLVPAIRKHDRRHLITVGMVPWSLDRPGLTSGFVQDKVAGKLDFVAVHLYPKKGQVDEAIKTLRGFSIGKPVVTEETFPLKCSPAELEEFLDKSKTVASGWIGFYWGKTLVELQQPKTISEAITRSWLELFQRRAKQIGAGNP